MVGVSSAPPKSACPRNNRDDSVSCPRGLPRCVGAGSSEKWEGNGARERLEVSRPALAVQYCLAAERRVANRLACTSHERWWCLLAPWAAKRPRLACSARRSQSYLVDPASSHMLVSKTKPCMCKYERICTVKLRMAH